MFLQTTFQCPISNLKTQIDKGNVTDWLFTAWFTQYGGTYLSSKDSVNNGTIGVHVKIVSGLRIFKSFRLGRFQLHFLLQQIGDMQEELLNIVL